MAEQEPVKEKIREWRRGWSFCELTVINFDDDSLFELKIPRAKEGMLIADLILPLPGKFIQSSRKIREITRRTGPEPGLTATVP